MRKVRHTGRFINGLTLLAMFAFIMRMRLVTLAIAVYLAGTNASALAQETPAPKQSLFSRVLHPFGSSGKGPEYKDPRIRGLVLQEQLPPEPIKLTEMRQLPVTIRLTNLGKRAVELNFPTEQRIEIYLRDSTGRIVNRWSDNRAFEKTPATLLVNPGEHLEYSETIATRDLTPGKVFTVEVFVPAYPELDVKRKALAAP